MAKNKQVAQFSVSIQKVFGMMKAIVDDGKEAEFLDKCRVLGDDRFVVANARIIALVKKFHAQHELSDNLGKSETVSPKVITATAATAATDDDQTCFKH